MFRSSQTFNFPGTFHDTLVVHSDFTDQFMTLEKFTKIHKEKQRMTSDLVNMETETDPQHKMKVNQFFRECLRSLSVVLHIINQSVVFQTKTFPLFFSLRGHVRYTSILFSHMNWLKSQMSNSRFQVFQVRLGPLGVRDELSRRL